MSSKKKYERRLLYILPIVIVALWIAIPTEPIEVAGRTIRVHLGLDLVGGVQALLEADVAEGVEISSESMDTARIIIDNRANGLLGVGEALVQQAGPRRIIVELPGETAPEKALAVLGEMGQLEFVDMGLIESQDAQAMEGMIIVTDYPAAPDDIPVGARVYHTVMAGSSLKAVGSHRDELGEYSVGFELDSEGTKIFRDYTAQNVGSFLAIVLDKEVISVPRVQSSIPDGQGVISGNFDAESAQDLAVQLRYGSLPIPLKVAESRTIGPSLGEDSLRQSFIAGLIGFGLVVIFMIAYYRLPGLIAYLALVVYIAITFALFKLIPVTLSLPGIAGFILSIGVAVDANILIFERMKEELRAGRRMDAAIEMGWDRAWPSIRDSNISTLITCGVLFWFGSAFGATIVKGFSVTLALGVGVSLFTAIIVTRVFLHVIMDNIRLADYRRWFGV